MLVFGFLSVSFFLTYSACFAQNFLAFFILKTDFIFTFSFITLLTLVTL